MTGEPAVADEVIGQAIGHVRFGVTVGPDAKPYPEPKRTQTQTSAMVRIHEYTP